MTPTPLESNKPPQREELLAPALSRAHKVWIKEAREFLRPVTFDTASFWDRWTAVRYLADQFQGQYRRECALVDELRPFLAPARVERLCRDAPAARSSGSPLPSRGGRMRPGSLPERGARLALEGASPAMVAVRFAERLLRPWQWPTP